MYPSRRGADQVSAADGRAAQPLLHSEGALQMARATRSWCCLLPFAFAALGASPSPMERADLTINNCEGYAIKFPHAARISVDKYCNDAASAYFVSGAGDRSVDGVYEKYGRLLGANKFERVLDDGTVYTLRRLPVGSPGSNAATWGLYRRGAVLYTSSGRSDRADPPPDGWRPAAGGVSPAPGLQAVTFPKRKLRIRRSSLGLRTKSPRQCDASARRSMLTQSCPEGADEELLDILHPAVGPQLGSFLRDRYKAAYPVESITLDGLIDADALSRALTFLDVPLSSWIGPEEAFYCCEKKFRLNFTEWPKTNVEVIGVQRLLSSSVFIRFLEELTGIRGLEPMTADDDRMLWAGSSLIAIAPGGYLHVHNDVRRAMCGFICID